MLEAGQPLVAEDHRKEKVKQNLTSLSAAVFVSVGEDTHESKPDELIESKILGPRPTSWLNPCMHPQELLVLSVYVPSFLNTWAAWSHLGRW